MILVIVISSWRYCHRATTSRSLLEHPPKRLRQGWREVRQGQPTPARARQDAERDGTARGGYPGTEIATQGIHPRKNSRRNLGLSFFVALQQSVWVVGLSHCIQITEKALDPNISITYTQFSSFGGF